MSVDSDLIMVAREVTRGGKTHTQHYWIRADQRQPDDVEVRDQAFIDKWHANRSKRIKYEQAYRARQKSKGKAKGPAEAPTKCPPRKSLKSALSIWPQSAAMEAARKDAASGMKPEAWLTKHNKVLVDIANDMVKALGKPFNRTGPYASISGQDTSGKLVAFAIKESASFSGCYYANAGLIQVNAWVVEDMMKSISRGTCATDNQRRAWNVYTHEVMHAVSNHDHEYEPQGAYTRPNAAMEEGLTEIRARAYADETMAAFGVERLHGPEERADGQMGGPRPASQEELKPLFTRVDIGRIASPNDEKTVYTVHALRLTKSVPYHGFVSNLGMLVGLAEGASHSEIPGDQNPLYSDYPGRFELERQKTPEGQQRHAEDHAFTQKVFDYATEMAQMRGPMRYNRLADRIIERYLDRSDGGFESARNQLVDVMERHMQYGDSSAGAGYKRERPGTTAVQRMFGLMATVQEIAITEAADERNIRVPAPERVDKSANGLVAHAILEGEVKGLLSAGNRPAARRLIQAAHSGV